MKKQRLTKEQTYTQFFFQLRDFGILNEAYLSRERGHILKFYKRLEFRHIL